MPSYDTQDPYPVTDTFPFTCLSNTKEVTFQGLRINLSMSFFHNMLPSPNNDLLHRHRASVKMTIEIVAAGRNS
jgi:hypothetical protein